MHTDLVRSILRPAPFKIGLLTILSSLLLFYSFGYQTPDIINAIDARIVDAMFKFRGPEQTTGKVIIVDKDEKSLRRFGQWPWPRDILAELTRKIYSASPLAVGFDILFAEPDRTSPPNVIARYPDLFTTGLPEEIVARKKNEIARFDHDHILGQAISEGPGILGYIFLFARDGLKNDAELPFPSVSISLDDQSATFSDLALPHAYRPLTNIPELSSKATSEGFFNIFPDPNGTVRKVPLFISLDDLPYPSLPLEMVRIGLGVNDARLHVSSNSKGPRTLLGVSLDQHLYRTDGFGNLTINFRGPSTTFITLSAADIIDGQDLDLLTEKYILIGSSAAGIMDIVATPFTSQMAGVEVHANTIDNLLAGDYLIWENYTEIGITYAVISLFGLLLTASLVYLSPFPGLLAGLGLLISTVAGNYFFLFLNRELLGISYILGTLTLLFLLVTFSNYFTEGRRKQFIRRAFSRYVSPSVVNELLKNQGKLNLQVTNREVTVLFADIRNFTRISETLAPEELGNFLNNYLSLMTKIIVRHYGMVDKFIGDGIMAVWGTPLDDKDHPVNTVRAAIDMLRAVNQPGKQLKLVDSDILIGIGINSGRVSAGNFGSNNRFTYTVLGDNVNLASRIEGLTKYYGIPLLLSESTVLELPEDMGCQFIDKVLVKGRHQPVSLFTLDQILFAPDSPSEAEKGLLNRGLAAYQQGEFTEALSIFEELVCLHPRKLYDIYIQRCQNFIRQAPPENWQAVWDHN